MATPRKKPLLAPGNEAEWARIASPEPGRLAIYMASAGTTTIRVPTRTRDRLKVLAARRGESASEVVTKLVSAADEEALLAEAESDFERLAADPAARAAYRAESNEIEAAFAAPAPEW
jgi:predicted DNA-binding protein